MGRKEINDYAIYKIVCLSNPDFVYVGSTANFYARRRKHKSSCNNPNDVNYMLLFVIMVDGKIGI